MAEPASIQYGTQTLTLTQATDAVLTRLLSRLPVDLWNTDPSARTLQRDVYRSVAQEIARWLESRTVATPMTLLLEAQGLDLDRLLRDYGLRRYMQRPDAYAQQIGLHCLYVPKATRYAIQRLADLLLAVPHVTLTTGPGEVHTFVAETQPVAAPYTFWQLVSEYHQRLTVTVHAGVPLVAPGTPPGLDTTPGGQPLDWFTLTDPAATAWYVGIRGGSLFTSSTPLPGVGTSAPFQVLDAAQGWWTLAIDTHGVLVTTPITGTPLPPLLDPAHRFEACRLIDGLGTPWWLAIEAGAGVLWPSLPVGATDVTPPGGPWRWLRLTDLQGRLWYGFADTHGAWEVSLTSPGGFGTQLPQTLGDARGVQWHYGIDQAGVFTTSSRASVTYGGLTSALVLHDAQGSAWCWRVTNPAGVPFFEVSAVLWEDAVATSPWGSLSWFTLLNDAGQTVYVFPSVVTGLPQVEGGPPPGAWWGWTEPLTFVDQQGTAYALSVDGNNVLAFTALPPDDIPAPTPTLSLRDFRDAMVHVRAQGTVVTLSVS